MEVVSWLVEQGATTATEQLVAAVELGFVACDDGGGEEKRERQALSGMLPEGGGQGGGVGEESGSVASSAWEEGEGWR